MPNLGANLTFESEETIHTSSAPAVAALLRRVRRYAGKRLRGRWRISAGARDMKAAYKQIALNGEQAQYVIVIIWDIVENRWRFVLSRALLFGLSGVVLLFNRVPALLVAIARR